MTAPAVMFGVFAYILAIPTMLELYRAARSVFR